MSRVLTGTVRTAALLAAVALASAGCDSISDAKESVDTATNTVQVCNDSIKLVNDRLAPVNAAITAASAAPGDPAKLAALQAAVKTEFGSLHTGLQDQITKAKDADVKSGLEALDTAVNGWATKPETFIKDPSQYTSLASNINKACGTK
jgi:hypothetical protein